MRRASIVLVVSLAVASAPLVGAQNGAPLPQFEVASVKQNRLGEQPSNNWRMMPNGVDYHNSQVFELVKAAFGDFSLRVEGAPDWTRADRYDVVVQFPVDTPAPTRTLMLRQLLIDRFKLSAHIESREVPKYSLVVARPDGRLGPKLQPGDPACAPTGRANPPATCGGGGGGVGRGTLQFASWDMTTFVRILSSIPAVGRPVVDNTGLTERYKIELRFAPLPPPTAAGAPEPPLDPDAPSIFTALQEQLGLKLDAIRGPVDVLVIDRIERPSPD